MKKFREKKPLSLETSTIRALNAVATQGVAAGAIGAGVTTANGAHCACPPARGAE